MNLRQWIKYLLWRDTTQHGEFPAIRRLMGPAVPKVVIDVGAHDGFYGSNSFPFVARGWRAVLIEPHPAVFARLQNRFARAAHVTCLNVACAESSGRRPLFVGADGPAPSLSTLCVETPSPHPKNLTGERILVPVETLGNVLASLKIAPDIGLLSIDTEGMDYEVLLGLDLSVWRPRIIFTEDHEPKEARKFEYLEANRYRLQARINSNTLWTRAVSRE